MVESEVTMCVGDSRLGQDMPGKTPDRGSCAFFAHVRECVCMCVHVSVCTHVSMCMHMSVHACLYVRVHVCGHAHAHNDAHKQVT